MDTIEFSVESCVSILGNTPQILRHLFKGVDREWVYNNEGPDTFAPFDVVGHLIHGERTDWRIRAELILSNAPERNFEPYDRFAQFEASKGKTLDTLLDTFDLLRTENVKWLQSLALNPGDLDKTGVHPGLGEVTLRQLLGTWVVHDLTHVAQITRVMAKQYREVIGPWAQYFRVLDF